MKRGVYGTATAQTQAAIGGRAKYAKYGCLRVTVNLSEKTFTEVKIAAMRNERSISAEINSRLERGEQNGIA